MSQLSALLISLIIEVPVVFMLGCFILDISSWEKRMLVVVAFAATLLTHPFAWMSNEMLIDYLDYPLRVTLIEVIVVVIESIIYKMFSKFNWWQSIFLSSISNTASFFVGLVIM